MSLLFVPPPSSSQQIGRLDVLQPLHSLPHLPSPPPLPSTEVGHGDWCVQRAIEAHVPKHRSTVLSYLPQMPGYMQTQVMTGLALWHTCWSQTTLGPLCFGLLSLWYNLLSASQQNSSDVSCSTNPAVCGSGPQIWLPGDVPHPTVMSSACVVLGVTWPVKACTTPEQNPAVSAKYIWTYDMNQGP